LSCCYGRELGFDEAFAFDYESSPITSPFVDQQKSLTINQWHPVVQNSRFGAL